MKKKEKDLMVYERKWQEKGYFKIAGVDEAGRGPIAGPLVVAAVILPREFSLPKLDDSKRVSPKNREILAIDIKKIALSFSIMTVEIDEIARLNIYQATKWAMKKAVLNLEITPEVVLTDAMPLEDMSFFVETIIKGDSLSANIAAASILAKVERDRIMQEIDCLFPQYGFAKHKGYPTKEHIKALEKFGVSSVHRKNYAPVRFWEEMQNGN